MTLTIFLSLSLYTVAPQIYPDMDRAKKEWTTVLKYMLPLGLLFASSLFLSNEAYMYSSIAFLQFCKEGNVALVFAMSCMLGLQTFSWTKVAILSVVILGCSLCADGEINFVMLGLILQLGSQVAECSKNIIGEIVMTGAGLKLDALTFVLFQAPCSLVFLLIGAVAAWTPDVLRDFKAFWPLILLNASLAFSLNVLIALTIKKLSALAFMIIGLVKDMVIVVSSSIVFGDPISHQQKFGICITILGIALWSHLKLQEQAEATRKKEELEPIMPKEKEAYEAA